VRNLKALKKSIWIFISLFLHVLVGLVLWSSPQGSTSSEAVEVVDLTLTEPLVGGGGRKAIPNTVKAVTTQSAKTQVSAEGQSESTTTQETASESSAEETTTGASGEDGMGSGEAVGWNQVTRLPRVAKEVKATYPEEAKQARIDGPVNLEILIDRTGKVRDVKMLNGPGYGLNESAIEAVKQFEFQPALRGSDSVAVKIRYTYRFKLGVN
jgi:protein TonB